MKDYGNSVALFGALGCMALLLVSMYFAKKEDVPVESPSQISTEAKDDVFGDDNKKDTTESTKNTSENEEGTEESTGSESEKTTETAELPEASIPEDMVSGNFVGAVTPDMQNAIDAAYKIDPEILHQIYPQELSIVGDSIASGFGAYQALDNPYDFAVGSLAARSIGDYTFTYGEGTYNYSEALEAAQPAYIYLSMGMNDVNMSTSDEYAENYKAIIESVQEVCPDSVIIVASVTPIDLSSTFTAQSTIQMFNEKLKAMVESIGSNKIVFYNAFEVVLDAATGGLASDYNGGDGIHLSYSAYYTLLENLYPVLDEMPVPEKVKEMAKEIEGTVSSEEGKEGNEDGSDDASGENAEGTVG